MRSFFIYSFAFYCVFNVCASDQRDTSVRKIYPFEEDRSASLFLQEEQRRSSSRGSHSSSDTISGGSVDCVEGCYQYVMVKDENGSGAQLEDDGQFYEECINVEFKLPE